MRLLFRQVQVLNGFDNNLAAAMPGRDMVENSRFAWTGVVETPYAVADGHIVLPETPGHSPCHRVGRVGSRSSMSDFERATAAQNARDLMPRLQGKVIIVLSAARDIGEAVVWDAAKEVVGRTALTPSPRPSRHPRLPRL